MGDTLRNLGQAIRSGGRSVQVGPNGDIRPEEQPAQGAEESREEKPKSTKLSEHTFGC